MIKNENGYHFLKKYLMVYQSTNFIYQIYQLRFPLIL